MASKFPSRLRARLGRLVPNMGDDRSRLAALRRGPSLGRSRQGGGLRVVERFQRFAMERRREATATAGRGRVIEALRADGALQGNGTSGEAGSAD
jgi:hypothetical protein